MSKTIVTFNGVTLNDSFIVSDLHRPFLMRTVNTTQVDGRDGSIYRSSSYDAIEVSMRLTFISQDKNARVMALANLVRALDVDEPAQLAISDDNGWYYLAIPKGGDISRWIGAESFPLTFVCPDPARYGDVISTSPATVGKKVMGGNVASYPTFRFVLVPYESVSPLYNVFVRVTSRSQATDLNPRTKPLDIMLKVESTARRYNVEVDCEHRVVRMAPVGAQLKVVVPGPTSQFAVFYPGAIPYDVYTNNSAHTMDTSSEYLTVKERWL